MPCPHSTHHSAQMKAPPRLPPGRNLPIPLPSAPAPTSPAAHQANQALRCSAWMQEGTSLGPWTLASSREHRPHRPRLSCARQHRLLTHHLLYLVTAQHSRPGQCLSSQLILATILAARLVGVPCGGALWGLLRPALHMQSHD